MILMVVKNEGKIRGVKVYKPNKCACVYMLHDLYISSVRIGKRLHHDMKYTNHIKFSGHAYAC